MYVGKEFIEVTGFSSLIRGPNTSFDYFHKFGCLPIVSLVVIFLRSFV